MASGWRGAPATPKRGPMAATRWGEPQPLVGHSSAKALRNLSRLHSGASTIVDG